MSELDTPAVVVSIFFLVQSKSSLVVGMPSPIDWLAIGSSYWLLTAHADRLASV